MFDKPTFFIKAKNLFNENALLPCIVISSENEKFSLGNTPLTLLPSPALNPSPLYAKIELSLISLLIKSIAGIDFS